MLPHRRIMTAVFLLLAGAGQLTAQQPAARASLERSPQDTARWGQPIDLLEGGLASWRTRGQANGWTVVNGVLINTPPSSDLISKLPLDDFKLHLEVNVPPQGNSGIYLRGRYEVQVLDSYGKTADSRQMGGVYGHLAPATNASRPAGQWQAYEFTMVGRRLKAVLNGVTIHDFAEIPAITAMAVDSNEAAPGTLMLQGDHTGVQYRNIRITPAIPADPPALRGLRASELSRFDAMRRADTTALRPLLADELVYTHSNATVETRDHHLEAIARRTTVYESLAPIVMRYALHGPDLALGNGVVKAKGMLNNAPFDVILRVTTVHAWREGRWQLLSWQSTRIP